MSPELISIYRAGSEADYQANTGQGSANQFWNSHARPAAAIRRSCN